MDLRLEHLALYKSLQNRKDDNTATALAGLLHPIASDARAHLEFIKDSFPSYTDHSIQHSLRIVDRIGQILSDEAQASLSPVEIFILLLAAMFHDAGMVADDGRDPNQVRRTHAQRSGEFIKRYLKERLNLFSEANTRLGAQLAFIVESHDMTWEQMKARKEFQHRESILNSTVRPNLLAILLRLGDLLDLDYERSPDSVRRCTPGFFKDRVSQLHHDRHTRVTSIFLDPKEIRIFVESPSQEADELWKQWFGYLRQDILHANTEVFLPNGLTKFCFPPPNLQIESVWQIPLIDRSKVGAVLDEVVANAADGVELLASIGEGDVLTSWLRRISDTAQTALKRVEVRFLSDAAIQELFKDSAAGGRFKKRLENNLEILKEECLAKHVELIVNPWQKPAPFHGFICGDHALVGEWVRGEDGVPHVRTSVQHIRSDKHPAKFAEYLEKRKQP